MSGVTSFSRKQHFNFRFPPFLCFVDALNVGFGRRISLVKIFRDEEGFKFIKFVKGDSRS